MSDLPLAELDAFAAVARLRSFRAAGKLRGVSASSLSEAMRRLEARLQVRLLNPPPAASRSQMPASGSWNGWRRCSAKSKRRSTTSTIFAGVQPGG